MSFVQKTIETEGTNIPVRWKLAALWIALMFLYIYADIFHLFVPGQIEKMVDGFMGPFAVTQGSLFSASALMLIPAVMIPLSLIGKRSVVRWANLIIGGLYTLVNISNLLGETWAYYFFYGIVEIVLTVLIAGYAWNWRKSE